MPAPRRVDRAGIVEAALALLDAHGEGGVTMGAVADAVGIRAPSLYKHFADRRALLVAARTEGFAALGRALSRGAARADPQALGAAYRRFAHRRPYLYALLFSAELPPDVEPAALEVRRAAAGPLLELIRAVRPDDDAAEILRAARVFTAYVHGHVMMELAGAFQLGPDAEAAFAAGIAALIHGLGLG